MAITYLIYFLENRDPAQDYSERTNIDDSGGLKVGDLLWDKCNAGTGLPPTGAEKSGGVTTISNQDSHDNSNSELKLDYFYDPLYLGHRVSTERAGSRNLVKYFRELR
jgi:hypothetical protein